MLRVSTAIIAGFCLAACAPSDTPSAPQFGAASSKSSNSATNQTRPWSGRCEGTAGQVDPTTIHIVADCNITHLGRSAVDGTEVVVPNATGFTVSATNIYTAADGDQLYTHSVGTAQFKADYSGVTFSGIETVTGGTGRFTNATGSATRVGGTQFSDGEGYWVNIGTLAYSASDKN